MPTELGPGRVRHGGSGPGRRMLMTGPCPTERRSSDLCPCPCRRRRRLVPCAAAFPRCWPALLRESGQQAGQGSPDLCRRFRTRLPSAWDRERSGVEEVSPPRPDLSGVRCAGSGPALVRQSFAANTLGRPPIAGGQILPSCTFRSRSVNLTNHGNERLSFSGED